MTDRAALAALRGAFERGDRDEFVMLCRRHADWLDANHDDWMRAGDESELARLRDDPDALQREGAFVIAVAQELDDLGRPGALNRLYGGDRGSPFDAFYSALAEAEELSAYGDHEAARSRVIAAMQGLDGSSGNGVAVMATDGHVALTHIALRSGDLAAAIGHNADALRTARPGSRIPKSVIEELHEDLKVALGLERGEPAADALAQVRAVIVRAQKLSDSGRYDASNAVLDDLLNNRTDSQRDAVARYEAKILGLRGLNLLRLGDRAAARENTRQALRICRAADDEFGVAVYEANLRELERDD